MDAEQMQNAEKASWVDFLSSSSVPETSKRKDDALESCADEHNEHVFCAWFCIAKYRPAAPAQSFIGLWWPRD